MKPNWRTIPRGFRAYFTSGLNELQGAIRSMIGAANAMDLGADGWIEVPYGRHSHPVGIQVLDRAAAESMQRQFNGLLSRLTRGRPVYIGHPDAEPWGVSRAERQEAANEIARRWPDQKAYGWIKEVIATDTALRMRIVLNEAGKALWDQTSYGYFSPHWGMEALPGASNQFRPVELRSIGMTNDPNIAGCLFGAPNTKAIPEQTKHQAMEDNEILALARTLGVTHPENMTPAQRTAAINSAAIALSGQVTSLNTQVTTLTGERDAAKTQLTAVNTQLTALRDTQIDTALTAAINEKRITEADKETWKGILTGNLEAGLKGLAALKPATDNPLPGSKGATTAANEKQTNQVAGLGARRGGQPDTGKSEVIAAINERRAKLVKEGLGYNDAHKRAEAEIRKEHPAWFEDDSSTATAA